ncbi:nitroreductase family protein [Actinacidiphila epipremni]|uniref:nitroreductase family protein n=1 Tax=Actinacidiphila epipremni TaxID=2053013 RepID=UPI002AFEE810|nr:nitroreductase family protein [Actinacidiphila epipremni]
MDHDREAVDSLHPLLAGRFSPARFDPAGKVDDRAVELLLEAARWAPSAGNSQPWAYVVCRPGEPRYERIVPHLAPSSARWATDAGLLVVTLAHRFVGGSEVQYSEFADYDLGQSVAHLTLQAEAMGLGAHQFRAFDLAALTAELRPNPGWSVVTMIAVGVPAAASDRPRTRRPAADLRDAPWAPADQE